MSLIAITPDKRYIVFSEKISSGSYYGSFQVVEFETMTAKRTIRLDGSHRATCMVTLPDNQHVAIVDHDAYHQDEDTLRIFDLLTGSCVNVCTLEGAGTPQVTPDGRYIVFTAGYGESIAIWDWRVGPKAQIIFSQWSAECIIRTINSDGSKVVVTHLSARNLPAEGKYKGPARLRVLSLHTGYYVCSFSGYQRAAALPDKARILAVAEETGVLTRLNIEKGEVEGSLDNPSAIPEGPRAGGLAITPNGKYAIAGLASTKNKDYFNLGIWDLQNAKLDHIIPWELHSSFSKEIAITSDSRYVLKLPGNERWDLQNQSVWVL